MTVLDSVQRGDQHWEPKERKLFGRRVVLPSLDIEKMLETCEYKSRLVRCPHKLLPASIIAVRWKKADGSWVRWKIADCPLLPAGLIDCEQSCLGQLSVFAP